MEQRIEFRQLVMLGALSSLLSFVFSGLEVLYTLYAINEMNIRASEWSQIRAYRYIFTLLMVLVLGTYAGKIGQKKAGAFTVALAVLNLLLFILYPSKLLLFITLPFNAAAVSMVTMSMNVLAQEVPERLQNVSNTVYRSAYTGLAVFGPLTIAIFADGGPRILFIFFTICLVICLPGLIMFPSSVRSKGDDAGSQTFRTLMQEWRLLLRNKSFIYFELLITTIYSAFLVNMIFGPIKLIQTLGMSEQQFSYTSTGAAAFTMLLILAAGALFGRMLLSLVYWPLLLISAGNVLFGMQSNMLLSIVLFIATNALNIVSFASISIWTSRIVPKRQLGFAFAFHKIFIAVFGFVFSLLLSLMEMQIGINACMIIMGMVGVVFTLLLRPQLAAGIRSTEQDVSA